MTAENHYTLVWRYKGRRVNEEGDKISVSEALRVAEAIRLGQFPHIQLVIDHRRKVVDWTTFRFGSPLTTSVLVIDEDGRRDLWRAEDEEEAA